MLVRCGARARALERIRAGDDETGGAAGGAARWGPRGPKGTIGAHAMTTALESVRRGRVQVWCVPRERLDDTRHTHLYLLCIVTGRDAYCSGTILSRVVVTRCVHRTRVSYTVTRERGNVCGERRP